MIENGQAGRRLLIVAEPLLLRAEDAARMVGLSGRTWQRLDVEGAVPAAVRLGSGRRWALPTLHRWVELGCPSRERFNELSASSTASGAVDRLPRGRPGRSVAVR